MKARAMVLAAGLGTRLRPLTDELPKPLVPVGDRPLVAHIADVLRRAGFSDVVMNTHHAAHRFSRAIRGLSVEVHLVHEVSIRGTAGGIAGARPLFGPAPVLVWNGDILTEPPIAPLLAGASSGGLCLAVARRSRGDGTVGTDEDGRVVRLRGETFGEEAFGGDYIGIAALGATALAELPAEGCLVGDYALPALRRAEAVTSVLAPGPWTDIGSLQSYLAANLEWLERAAGEAGSWTHPTARVDARVTPVRSLIGDGAVVSGEGSLERCVVWPGAHAVAPLRDSIVTAAGRIVGVP